jgi:hypothetical protein
MLFQFPPSAGSFVLCCVAFPSHFVKGNPLNGRHSFANQPKGAILSKVIKGPSSSVLNQRPPSIPAGNKAEGGKEMQTYKKEIAI